MSAEFREADAHVFRHLKMRCTICTSAARKPDPKVAAILSVVESCRRLGIPVKEYLADILPGLD